jgi:tetratricopeptide (TPR) repeat protein
MRMLDPGDHEALAAGWVRSARWHRAGLCDPPRAGEEAGRALAELDAGGIDDTELRAEAVALLAWLSGLTGDVDRGEALLEELRPLVEDLGRPPLLLHDESVAHGHLLLRRARWRESCEAHVQSARWAAIAGRPDMAFAAWINAACAAATAGEFDLALELTDRGLAAVGHVAVLAAHVHAARAYVLARIGRHEDARAALAAQRDRAEHSGDPALVVQAEADAGLVLLACGELEEGAARLATALAGDARIRRPVARLRRAEALARLGRSDEAEAELRATVQEPITPGDRPASLVPRMAHVQGLIAHRRGYGDLARRRLEESAAGWRRHQARDPGEEYAAHLVDLGRPPVAGLLEPERELKRVLADLHGLKTAVT